MRMKRFHAARASFSWLDDPSSDGGDASGAATDDATTPAAASTTTRSSSLSFIDREAAELAAFSGAATVVPPFTALSMPLSPDVCARIAKAYLERSIAAAEQAMAAAFVVLRRPTTAAAAATRGAARGGPHPRRERRIRSGSQWRHLPPLREARGGALPCRDDGSRSGRTSGGHQGGSGRHGVAAIDIAVEVRRQGVHVLVDLGHADTSDVTEVALRPAACRSRGVGTPAPMGDAPTTASMGGGGGGGGGGGARGQCRCPCTTTPSPTPFVPDEALR